MKNEVFAWIAMASLICLSPTAARPEEPTPEPIAQSHRGNEHVEALPASAAGATLARPGKWDMSLLTSDRSVELRGDTTFVDVDLHDARITGDLILRTLPLHLNLRDAVVTGSIWIGDWPDKKEETVFPPENKKDRGYPGETEGCWNVTSAGSSRVSLNENIHSTIDIRGVQTRNVFMKYVHVKSLSAQYAEIKYNLETDFSRFDDDVNLGWVTAMYMQLVGASFAGDLSVQSAQLAGLDLVCVRLAGNLEALSLHVTGLSQWVGLTPLGTARPSFDLSGSRFGALALRGVRGKFNELNLGDATVGILNLDFDESERQPNISPSLKGGWSFERVRTNGAFFEKVRPAPDYPGAGERIEAFARRARLYDEDIYRKLAQAYERDDQQEAADEEWARHSLIAFLLHLPRILALRIGFGMLLAGGALGAWRLHRFHQGRRGAWCLLDGFLLALDLLLPEVISIGVSKRHERYLRRLFGLEELLVVAYRLAGWILLVSIAAQVAFIAGRSA
jgi:hypothetical protein